MLPLEERALVVAFEQSRRGGNASDNLLVHEPRGRGRGVLGRLEADECLRGRTFVLDPLDTAEGLACFLELLAVNPLPETGDADDDPLRVVLRHGGRAFLLLFVTALAFALPPALHALLLLGELLRVVGHLRHLDREGALVRPILDRVLERRRARRRARRLGARHGDHRAAVERTLLLNDVAQQPDRLDGAVRRNYGRDEVDGGAGDEARDVHGTIGVRVLLRQGVAAADARLVLVEDHRVRVLFDAGNDRVHVIGEGLHLCKARDSGDGHEAASFSGDLAEIFIRSEGRVREVVLNLPKHLCG
mmetsp:Transcript_8659/g.20255  ORF Transcript_8659/g.20255 Transcript_8659/m.20255 type:complete len:304 (-) Transcript_8659:101-1012(-)